ncbi:hypothetical protein [Tropicimonas marinistellae]|uniref:hypothetical protein n=1 Tax=Tropicimonas marinistellae TaxID=1739787 RepID=UPI00082CEE06|nr:hypothetical protein [Tropicimonas marinistellae]
MRQLCILLLLCDFWIASVLPATAGGAWPRGEGRTFISLSWSTFGDAAGYLEKISQPIDAENVPELKLTDEIAFFAEYGITERLTFGVDTYNRPDTGLASNVLFLRSGIGNPDWANRYGIEIGFGPIHDWRGQDDTVMRVGLAWGRGYQSRWGNGWMEVDSKLGWQTDAAEEYWKIDSTLGLNATERSIFYFQLQSGAAGEADPFLRAVPAYVFRFDRGISVESALLLGMQNDDAQGVKIGAWLEF